MTYKQMFGFFSARQEKENQARNKDPGESAGWPKYHLTVRYRQGSCGNFYFDNTLLELSSTGDLISLFFFFF